MNHAQAVERHRWAPGWPGLHRRDLGGSTSPAPSTTSGCTPAPSTRPRSSSSTSSSSCPTCDRPLDLTTSWSGDVLASTDQLGVLSRRVSRPTARIMVMVLAAGMVSAVPSPTDAADHVRPRVQDQGGASAQGRALPGKPRPDNPAERAALGAAPTVAWPPAAVAQIEVRDAVATVEPVGGRPGDRGLDRVGHRRPEPAVCRSASPRRAGSPAPTRVRLEVLPREASARAGSPGPCCGWPGPIGHGAAPVRVTPELPRLRRRLRRRLRLPAAAGPAAGLRD